MSLDGKKVMMSRAPMTTPSVMKVRVIYDDHPLADWFEEDTAYISPIGNVRDAGDCDGDNRVFCDAGDSNLELTTFDDVVNNVVERTGSDQLVPGGAYWGDHYNVPSEKAVAKKRGLGAKNLSIDLCSTDLRDKQTRKSLPEMLEGSTLMFQEAVGWVHRLFLTADLYLSLVWSLQDDLKKLFPDWTPPEFTKNKSLVLILAEIYEVPLGGLSWEAYDVIFGTLIPVIQGMDLGTTNPEVIAKFEKELNAADMNGACALDIYSATKEVAACRNISKSGEVTDFYESPEDFIKLTAEMAALISKGQFDVAGEDTHKSMVDNFVSWLTTINPSLSLVEKSITVAQCWEFCKTIAVAIQGEVVEIDLDLF